MRALRLFGAGWSSRILQDALAFLLEDADARARVDDARRMYAARREALASALREHGIETFNRDGLSLWVPVADEHSALVTLAAHGIAVSPGSRYLSGALPDAHIRVSTGIAPADGHNWRAVAEVLAMAAAA
jgi:DNA-binding transcriptional MocR family regulator